MISRRVVLAAGLSVSLPVSAQDSGRRVGLVIGNSAYSGAPLPNAANDAKAVGAALRALGFEVVEVHDAGKQRMVDAIGQSHTLLRGHRGVGLLYYAGHGLQVNWHNYMVPVDAAMATAADVPKVAIDIQGAIEAFRSAGARMNIVVLDACRDNPFGPTASGKGLAPMDAPPGTYLAYATAPGNVAEDGAESDGNGLYTRFLLEALSKPGARIEDVFKRVRMEVRRASQGRQVPWDMSSLEEDFIFAQGVLKLQGLAGAEREQAFELEKTAWDRVKSSGRVEDVYGFLQAHPHGYLAELGEARVEQLQQARLEAPVYFAGTRYVVGDYYEVDRIDGFTKVRTLSRVRVTQADARGVAFNNREPSRTADGGITRSAEDRFDPPIMQYPGDISVGKRWRTAFDVTYANGETSRNYWEFRVLNLESLTVPAGTFKALHVEGKGEGSGVRGHSIFSMSYWVDPATMLQLKSDLLIRHNGRIVEWNGSEMRRIELVAR